MAMAEAFRVAVPHAIGGAAPLSRAPIRTLGGHTMGTTWSVRLVGSEATAQSIYRAVRIALDRVVAQMSAWVPHSDLSRFNRVPCGAWRTLPVEFGHVVDAGLRIAEESGGAYDPAIGKLVDLWGFGAEPRQSSALPSPDRVAGILATSGRQYLAFDRTTRKLKRTTPASIDVNGIAKGFAVDLAMAAVRRHGCDHALVEIGGELKGCGVKPDGSPWWTAIDRPASDIAPDVGAPLLVALHGLAIATSGCERSFAHDGRRYSHTIDPRTGWPIANGMVTATVLHASCMEADAYATALMVLGPDDGLAFATERNLPAVMLFRVRPDGPIRERLSPALKALLE